MDIFGCCQLKLKQVIDSKHETKLIGGSGYELIPGPELELGT